MSYVRQKDGSFKRVTNLGWLLRHWDEVREFHVVPHRHDKYRIDGVLRDLPEKTSDHYHCWLIARLHSNVDYVTEWADHMLLKDWLVRPKFMGVGVTWFGIRTTIPDSRKDW